MHIYTETAVSASDGNVTFYRDLTSPAANYEWAASLVNWQNRSDAELVVKGIDFGKWLNEHVFLSSNQDAKEEFPVIMKLDIEGAEFETVPNLLASGALCRIGIAMVEWHEHIKKDHWVNGTVWKSIIAFLNNLKACRTQFIDMDDESYGDSSHDIPLVPCN